MTSVAPVAGSPRVSVVMSVYNGGESLADTLESVLGQTGCDFEFIAINDGSTDTSAAILDDCALRDPRLRVFHQANQGLTRALIRGCAEARGDFIARQDADDLSLPNRLQEQSSFLLAHPEAVLVASSVRFLAPGGEWLFDNEPPDIVEVQLDIDKFRVPPLFGTLFRRDAYIRAGGFRKEFSVAQDVDLWLRLVEVGPCLGLRKVHYQSRMTLGGITSRCRDAQFNLAMLAIACAKQRRSGQGDQPLLDSHIPHAGMKKPMTRQEQARFHYYIGSCLRKHDRAAARSYFQRALRDDPLHVKALFRWMTA